LAAHCDAGTVEDYAATAFKAVAAHIVSLMPSTKVKPALQ
jgi:hypothetical protein